MNGLSILADHFFFLKTGSWGKSIFGHHRNTSISSHLKLKPGEIMYVRKAGHILGHTRSGTYRTLIPTKIPNAFDSMR